MTIVERFDNAKCCLGTSAYKLVQAQWKGEDWTCKLYDAIAVFNAVKAIENSLNAVQSAQAIFDLTNFDVEDLTLSFNVVTSLGQTIATSDIAKYADLDELINTIVNNINLNQLYTATRQGDTILLQTTQSSQIGVTATLSVIGLFQILNKQDGGSVDYTFEISNGNPSFMDYNPTDGYTYITTVNFVGGNIVGADGTVVSAFGYPDIGARDLAVNVASQELWIGHAGEIYTIGLPSGALTDTIAVASIILTIKYSSYNDQMYVLANDGVNLKLFIYDSAHTLVATLTLGSSIAQTENYNLIAILPTTVYVSNFTADSIQIIDADPISGTYNTLINTLAFSFPRTIKYLNGNIYIASGSPGVTISRCDLSMNILFSSDPVFGATFPYDFAGRANMIVSRINGLNQLYIYRADNLEFLDNKTNTDPFFFFNHPDGNLWLSERNVPYVAIFFDGTTDFTFDIDFDDTSSYELNCLTLEQINILFCQAEKYCDTCGGSQGSFGDSVNVLGDGNGNAIDGNGDYIQV